MKEPFQDNFDERICAFRDSIRAGAEMPDKFWASQRRIIAKRLDASASERRFNLAWLLAPAAIVAFLIVFQYPGKDNPPMPDFAAGADQNLLMDVEQALGRNYPEALIPAEILIGEIR